MGDPILRSGNSSVDGSAAKAAQENRLSVAGKAWSLCKTIKIAKAVLGVLCALPRAMMSRKAAKHAKKKRLNRLEVLKILKAVAILCVRIGTSSGIFDLRQDWC